MAENVIHQEFVALLTEYQPRLAVFVRSLVPDASAARDVLQETNLTLWKKVDQFELGTSFWAWASRVAFFEVRAYRTRCMRDRFIFDDELLNQLATLAEEQGDLTEARRAALRNCLQKLSARDRELIQRRYDTGRPLAAVAAEVGRSVEATRKVLQRARRALFACIERTLAAEERI